LFFVSNNEELKNIINKEVKKRDFKPNNDQLEGDALDPNKMVRGGPIDIWLPPVSPNQPFRLKDPVGTTPPINPPYISIENSTSL
jgi:hypothetical protein